MTPEQARIFEHHVFLRLTFRLTGQILVAQQVGASHR